MKNRKMYLTFLVVVSVMLVGSLIHAGSIDYDYDELNRLITIEKPDEYRIEYSYDPVGNRTAKVIQFTTPSFDSDGDGDVDGSDLAAFCTRWDGSFEALQDFAAVFGSN